jgi:hypothetical protein
LEEEFALADAFPRSTAPMSAKEGEARQGFANLAECI